jgi:hypothetical protein
MLERLSFVVAFLLYLAKMIRFYFCDDDDDDF